MKKQSGRAESGKECLKVSCFYKENGIDVGQIIKQSFQLFIKGELIKQCG